MSETQNPAAVLSAVGAVEGDLAISPTNILEALRVQYLSVIFGMEADTALAIAELAFGEVANGR